MRSSMIAIGSLLLLCLPYSLHAEPQNSQESVRAFVQGFYDWYVPTSLRGTPLDVVLNSRARDLSPELVRALKEDAAAQAKRPDEIVGFDSDPFLNTQDPGERYEVGRITQKGGTYFVEIYGVFSGKRSAQPDVIAEITKNNGPWMFINFD